MDRKHTLGLLQKMIGEDKDFRPGQWEAIEAVAIKKQRVLVVQLPDITLNVAGAAWYEIPAIWWKTVE